MQMRCWHDGWKKFNPLRTGGEASDRHVCLKTEGDGGCCWECPRAVGIPETRLSVHPLSRVSAALCYAVVRLCVFELTEYHESMERKSACVFTL